MKKRHLLAPLVLTLVLLVGGCVPNAGNVASQPGAEAGTEPIELRFSIWAGCEEAEGLAYTDVIKNFEEANPNVKVKLECTPDNYTEKIATMLVSNTLPDIGYLNEATALEWASEGKLLDLTDYFKEDPEASSRLPQAFYRFGEDRILGTNTAGEIMLLFYNKANFDTAGLAYPPTKAGEAWTWDEFVDACKQLTIDANGNTAASADFDPESIDTYGCNVPNWWASWNSFIESNGGQMFSDDGMTALLDSPESKQVFQALYDLVYVHHVAPTPAASESREDVTLRTGKLAMQVDGHWATLGLAQTEGLEFGIGVLPSFQEPKTTFLGGVTVIFGTTKHPKEAFDFYVAHNSDIDLVPMFKGGLWMPLQAEYYTDPAKTEEWIRGQPGAYPEGAEDSVVDYAWNYSVQAPIYWVKNWTQIMDEAITPAMQGLMANELTVDEAVNQAVTDAAPLMQGTWVQR
ncbi:MAG: sugar ABC transporter substrate-binding protein [Caldilineaceae bacterium]